MEFTREQQQVIDLRDRNLLVSAAAGSGKTAVLVERILSRITDEKNPIDVDELLIVTFTNAAAAEMRERIGAAIERKLETQPQSSHLQRQQTLLHHAQITTIHSFCLFVIRNYFHRIDLEPDFRIGEEGELRLLKGDVLDDVLERYYQEDTPEFVRLAETLATGKSDEKLKETILTLYEFAMSAPWPEEWLKACTLPYEISSEEAFKEQPMFQVLLEYLRKVTAQWAQMLHSCVEISMEADGPKMYTQMLEQEEEMLKGLADCGSYESFGTAIGSLSFGRLPAARRFEGDEKKKKYVQELRNEVKDSRKKLTEQFFFLPPREMVEGLRENAPVIAMLVQVTIDFMRAYSEKKREKNLLDYSDMEHFALAILVDGETKEPTQTALELQKQFKEIMTDEYQDSNYVQETILKAVSRERNRFMVGDVKQSIYRFRMARPELFMEKYDSYTSEDSGNQKIDLHKNFRSRGEVLKTVNDVFYRIMGKDLGNVEYDEAAALYQGMEFAQGETPGMYETETLLADPADWEELEAEELEAAVIAGKLKRLMESQQVTDKKTGQLRPMEYGDVVILVRSLSSMGAALVEGLKSHGIPAAAATGTGYFSAMEVQTVLNYLRLMDNPRQDIPMAAALGSYFGGISEEEMAKIRIQFPEGAFFKGVFAYAQEGREEGLRQKLQQFLERLWSFRKRVIDTPIHELLQLVMNETGYLDYVYALPGGSVRRANLEMLLEKAISYEKTSYHGLFHFIRYVNQLQRYEVDYGEAEDESYENIVRIMTIHKSKGLEFPVVFVAGMGKQLNQQDIRSRLILHPGLGIGLDITDLERRVRIPSLSRQILARQIQMENAGEELRVLYVAMTRAKEKLILTGTLKKAREKLDSCEYQSVDEKGHMGFLTRLRAGCYFDWVLPALVQKQYRIHLVTPLELAENQAEKAAEQEVNKRIILAAAEHAPLKLARQVESRLSYTYPYEKEAELKAKLSVSELKHRAIDRLRQEEPDAEYIFEEPELIPYIPAFMEKTAEGQEKGGLLPGENPGALRGTAMHRVLECFDFTRDFNTLPQQISEMAESGRLERRLQELVSQRALEEFFKSGLADRMQQAARNGRLYREKPFVMGKAAREVYEESDSDALVLIQGIMDAFFEEDGELVLVDYKTDAVKTGNELKERYKAQMDLYQEALNRATGKRVKEKLLYSFKLKEIIAV